MTVLAGAGIVADGLAVDSPAWIEHEGGVITAIGAGTRRGADAIEDAVLVPGFVDLQVNGIGAVDFATAERDAWRVALREQARHGVTACCPTLVSAPLDAYVEPLHVAASLLGEAPADAPGAAVLGVHLEGPFLGGAPGAHVVEHLRPVDESWLRRALDTLPGVVRVVTLAPEADAGLRATRLLHDADVVVAIGHSTATYAEACAAADAGARLVTHLFNGMGPFHHREPGVAGAALTDVRLTPTVIADLVHVHPAALQVAIAAKRSIAIVTDAVAVGAAFDWDERAGAARLADGTLAGAVAAMDAAVRNIVGLGVPLARAAELAATIPCEVLGLTDRGRLEPGRRADIVALDRESLAVRAVWIAGVEVTI